jgi:hypothetical protein
VYIVYSLTLAGTSSSTTDPAILGYPQAAVPALIGTTDQFTTDQTIEARPMETTAAVVDFTNHRGERSDPVVIPVEQGRYSSAKPAIVRLARLSLG